MFELDPTLIKDHANYQNLLDYGGYSILILSGGFLKECSINLSTNG